MKRLSFAFLAISIAFSACMEKTMDRRQDVSSPSGVIKVAFFLSEEGQPGYYATYNGRVVVDSSMLGNKLSGAVSLDKGFSIEKSIVTSFDETWEQPWGEKREIRNNYNELNVSLTTSGTAKVKQNIVFRVYDYGIGFRYEYPEQPNLAEFEIMDELTEFNMTGNHDAWWIPAYKGNRYEFLYSKDPINTLKFCHTPFTMESADGLYISIHEAALTDYASMTIQSAGNNKLKCDLVPWKNGIKTYAKTGTTSPWRTLQIAEKPGDLISSYLILNLNEPNKLEDVSWVKPGKYIGIWWEMFINKGTWAQGPMHAANTKNAKKYIDFASKHRFSGILIEGWNYGWDGEWMNSGDEFNFTKPYPDYDIEEISKYAKEKGVFIIGHHETGASVDNYERQLDDAFKYLDDHGMRAVKSGYVGDSINNGEWHHGQYIVRHHRRVIETAAKNKVMLVAHEPIKPTGIRRTYPNMIAREGARGQEYNAWQPGNGPNHTTILPFTRLLAGPMDYTPGILDISLPSQPNGAVPSTIGKELAHYVIIYSPMQMAADLPENYEGHPAFEFIKDVATDWEDTKVVDAAIGEHVTIARQQRNSENWYVGTITNEDPRSVSIPLDFLDDNKEYNATIYGDAEGASYKDNPTAYQIQKTKVNKATVLDMKLGAGGGAAICIKPAT